MATKFDARQTISRDTLSRITGAANSELDNILRSLDKEVTPPLELKASSPNDLIVTIGSISVTNGETSKNRVIPPISNLIPSFTSGTVTFPASSGGNAVPSAGSSIVITISSGNYLKVGINLDANGNLVLQAGTEGASVAAATNPPSVPNTFGIGYVVLHNVAGTIQNISNSDLYQYVGGGGGSGSGDASSLTTRLLDKFQDSTYKQLTAVDFSSDATSHVDGSSTGAYSLVSGTFEINIGEKLVTTQLLSADEFLPAGKALNKVSLSLMWHEDFMPSGTLSYSLSRNGGAQYQIITMEQVGLASNTLEGELVFANTETNVNLQTQTANGTSFDLDATNQQALAQKIIVASTEQVRNIRLEVTKTGSPSGFLWVSIYSSSANLPSALLVESAAVAMSSISTGNLDIPLENVLLPGTYHVVIRTDAAYKASYTNGVTELSLKGDAAAESASQYNGSSWSDFSTNALTVYVQGYALDLRLKVDDQAFDLISVAKLLGYGVFYDQEYTGVVGGVKNLDKKVFTTTTNTDTFTLGFLPDPDLLTVYYVERGQVFKYGAFTVNGYDVSFPANTFYNGGIAETVTLLFSQLEGNSFDNSDVNANKLAQITQFKTKTSAYTAVNLDKIFADTSGGAFTITLPTSPSYGDVIEFFDASGTWNTNNLTVNRNSQLINGVASNLILNTAGTTKKLIFFGGSQGWRAY